MAGRGLIRQASAVAAVSVRKCYGYGRARGSGVGVGVGALSACGERVGAHSELWPAGVRCFGVGWKKKKAATAPKQTIDHTDLYYQALEPPPREHVPMTDEEKELGRKLVNKWTSMKWKREKIMAKDDSTKIKRKWAAIGALPTEERRVEAVLITDCIVPYSIRLPSLTPPQNDSPDAAFGEYINCPPIDYSDGEDDDEGGPRKPGFEFVDLATQVA